MTRETTQGDAEIQDNRWKLPVCILYLILGILISFVLFQFLSQLQLDNFIAGSSIIQHKGKPNYFSVTYVVIYTLCLFIGSMITGYLCQPYVKNTISFSYLSSGLYMILLIIPTSILTSFNIFLKFIINPGILWIASSIGGVYFGRFVGRVSRGSQRRQALTAGKQK